VRTGVERLAASTFAASNFSGVRWAYRPLAALGVLFALVAAATQLLLVAARRQQRRAAHLVMRRTGVTGRMWWTAAVVESAVPLVWGAVVGVAAGLVAVGLSVGHLDPMPTLAPPARAALPWDLVIGMAVVVPIWALVIAAVIVHTTRRGDPFDVLRGDQ
jgi:hypothetical protein